MHNAAKKAIMLFLSWLMKSAPNTKCTCEPVVANSKTMLPSSKKIQSFRDPQHRGPATLLLHATHKIKIGTRIVRWNS